jgi:uncharacterized protein (TIGR02246 family)
MKIILFLFLISSVVSAQTSDTNNDNDLIIQQIIKDQEEGWNNGDAKQYSRSFGEEGVFTIITGATFHSRGSLEERVAFILAGFFKNSTLTQKIVKIDFIADNIAVVEIETEMTGFKSLPPGVKVSADQKLRTSMLQVLKKSNEAWKVVAFHNVDVKVQ